MKRLILLFLFSLIVCGDYRKPSKVERKCIIKKIGIEPAKKLFASLRKYHRSHGKATLLDYINAEREDLKELADECLLKINKRRNLNNKKNKSIGLAGDLFNSPMASYYLEAMLRDEKVKKQLLTELSKSKVAAIAICKEIISDDTLCKLIAEMLITYLESSNNNK